MAMVTRCPRLALAAVAVALLAAACSGDAVVAGDSQAVDEVRVRPPLPWGVRDIWYHQTGLLLTVDEDVWADRLDRVCKTALGADARGADTDGFPHQVPVYVVVVVSDEVAHSPRLLQRQMRALLGELI